MATSDHIAVPSRLFIPSGSYTTGGTSLGEVAGMIVVEVGDEYELLKKQDDSKGTPTHARHIESIAVLEFLLMEDSDTVREQLATNRTTGSGRTMLGFGSRVPGGILVAADYIALQVRPNDTSVNRHHYFPRALVTRIARRRFRHREGVTDGSVVHVTALADPNGTNEPWYDGNPDDFPSL